MLCVDIADTRSAMAASIVFFWPSQLLSSAAAQQWPSGRHGSMGLIVLIEVLLLRRLSTHHHPCSGQGGLADRTSTRTTASTSTGLMALSKGGHRRRHRNILHALHPRSASVTRPSTRINTRQSQKHKRSQFVRRWDHQGVSSLSGLLFVGRQRDGRLSILIIIIGSRVVLLHEWHARWNNAAV